jgi:hypothetical protein
MPVIVGVTSKDNPFVAIPFTVTTIGPSYAASGTDKVMLVLLQAEGVTGIS